MEVVEEAPAVNAEEMATYTVLIGTLHRLLQWSSEVLYQHGSLNDLTLPALVADLCGVWAREPGGDAAVLRNEAAHPQTLG